MEISTDLQASKTVGKVFTISGSEKKNETQLIADIDGYQTEGEIHLAPNRFYHLIGTYAHELGHSVQDELSAHSGDVLSPTELLDLDKASATLSVEEVEYLNTHLLGSQYQNKMKLEGVGKTIVDKFFSVYTKNMALPEVKLFNDSQEEMNQFVIENNSNVRSLEETKDKEVILVNNRQARNAETTSMYAELACYQILENTLKKYNLIKSDGHVNIHLRNGGYQRVQNIFAYVTKRQWPMPTLKDLLDVEIVR